MQKILKEFLSIRFAIVLFLAFAIACAVATIIETIKSTDVAWAYVYNAHWFELIMALLCINLIYNIYKYKILNIKKLPSFLFHVSFVFIFLGALITRFFGFEGMMHIRENSKSDEISTREVYIQLISKDKNGKEISVDKNQYIATNGNNSFSYELEVDNKPAVLSYKDFILNAKLDWVEGQNGQPKIKLLFSDERNKRDVVFKSGDSIEAGPISFTFNSKPKQASFVNFILKNGQFFINTNQKVTYMSMTTMKKGEIEQNKDVPVDNFSVYSVDGLNFAPVYLLKSAVERPISVPQKTMGNNALIANLSYNGEEKEVYMMFGEKPHNVNVGGKEFQIAWAPKIVKIPFSIYLKDFKLDRYPGSNSPSGYSSEVEVLEGGKKIDYEIYMNHVLDYAGYRFFQSSYDMDEKGTILSVNKDPGKIPTYIGYFLLSLGMLLNFFNPNSRFNKLAKLIDESSADRKKMKENVKNLACVLVLLFATLLPSKAIANENVPYIDKAHSDKLASLVVQGFDGRMAPFDTIARELMNKVHRSENYEGLNHNQVMLSMMVNPGYWKDAKFIKVSENGLKDILGIPHSEKYAKFGDFYGVDKDGKSYYKLAKLTEEINRKPAGNRSVLDKEILKVDERANIFYMIYMGEIFRIIPKENSINNEWFSPVNAMMSFQKDEASRASKVLENYFSNVIKAQESKDWSKANKGLEELKAYQEKYGAKVIPSQNKLKFEILFNKIKIFERLVPVYLLAGLALLVFVFVRMMKPNVHISFAFKFVYIINILAFILHTLGLILRWYISGHEPWSNAYESMVYIAWALSLSGMIFSKRSAISLALTSILAGITLFVAHLSIMDPQITNIQPVLKSYWLTIHVSVITASYGFLGLCALLGFFTLILFIMQKENEDKEITKNILEATRINEMAMILGICLLTVGNFLGGVWANESWGRYWGWDPKETWALITILVYACVVHFRFVPKLNDQYLFAVASLFAYSSVIMTYFGVNFYLSGMHSYGSGERVPVPNSVWITLLVMIIVSLLAFKKRKFSKKL